METGVKRKKLVPLYSCQAELCIASNRGGELELNNIVLIEIVKEIALEIAVNSYIENLADIIYQFTCRIIR